MKRKIPYEHPSVEVVRLDVHSGICQASSVSDLNVYMMVDDFGNVQNGSWDDEW